MDENKVLAAENEEEDTIIIGRWGHAWQAFMEENYPKDAAELKRSDRWGELTYEVEKEALEFSELLRSQYAKANPRPREGFLEIARWENTRGFYVNHEVMEQIVLQYRENYF